MDQMVAENGGQAAKKKPCSCRRSMFFLIFMCTFVILFCLNSTETTLAWKDQLWSHYFNAMSKPKLFNWSANSHPNQLFRKHNIEYKSPGPYFVEYPYKYNFIINEEKKCQELKPYLVLVVPVAPQNKVDRQIIRQTWGAQEAVLNQRVTLFFLLGLGKADEKELLEESKEYGDMIQADFIDCYKNLTIKSMMMLEWLDSHCRDATYAMKIDSDMFLNLPNLVGMLQSAPKTSYLTGLVEWAAVVHRDTGSKWFVPFDIFIGDTYPPYALGLGYVLSLDLAGRLVEASRWVKALYIEDVYLGMCMHRLGLQPTNPPLDGAFHVFPLSYDRCMYSKIIATTLLEHTDRQWLWQDFTKPGPYCGNHT